MTEPKRVFVARAGANGEDEEYALENGMVVIGFESVPSLEGAKTYDDIFKIVEESMPNEKPRAIGNYAGQLSTFSMGIKEGDIVVLPRKLTSQIAIGVVEGPYRYEIVRGDRRHTRKVKWTHPDLPRTHFHQDILYSFGAFMTVCRITRNEAEFRIATVMEGKPDPGFVAGGTSKSTSLKDSPATDQDSVSDTDIEQLAQDQIARHIQSRFAGHALSQLVEAVLKAEGWVTRLSPPGADGGVDILAGRGSLGLDQPRLCVQVKSQTSPVDVTVFRTLQGSMQSFNANQGLLVSWGGFNRAVMRESQPSHFFVRLWDSKELVEAVYRNYERLPAEIQTLLPLKRVWILVPDNSSV